jgi:maleamate amidohydrolase
MPGDALTPDEAYQRSGYGVHEIPLGERVAVLTVDLQRGFTSGDLPLGSSLHVQHAVIQAGRLLEQARAVEVPVFHTFVRWRDDGADLGLWSSTVPELARFTERSGWDTIDDRVLAPGDITIHKRKPSAFFGTGLDAIFREQGIDTLVMCGVTTSGCVRASIVDAFSYGFRVVVAADACGDQDPSAHEANLADVARRYANVWDVDQVCRRALDRPQVPV